ncbi:hypothetical protein CI1B_55000 [Bradyrhizobium ivorense]|uniref:Uncharacterized protein n=1 Tax=Bradyrhizobium ivorense TaxID=2511166 RepID=A0A508TK38_9BRAD|nr:hypothetical protein [Bradyrhizobium ivorense]VIO74722.1 hypothetical protein CI1B_55000 [Bradyrhizobium ivorense]
MANFCAPPGVPLGDTTGYFPEGGAGGPLSVGRMTIKTRERKEVGLEFYKVNNRELWLKSTNDRVVKVVSEKVHNDIEKIYTLQAGDLVEKVTVEAGLDQSAWIKLEVVMVLDRTPDKLTKAEILALLRQTVTLNELKLQLGLGPVTNQALARFVISKGVTIRDFGGPDPSDEIEKQYGEIKELHEPYDRRRRTIYVRDGLNPLHKEAVEGWWTPEEAEEEWLKLSADQNREAWYALAQEMQRFGPPRSVRRTADYGRGEPRPGDAFRGAGPGRVQAEPTLTDPGGANPINPPDLEGFRSNENCVACTAAMLKNQFVKGAGAKAADFETMTPTLKGSTAASQVAFAIGARSEFKGDFGGKAPLPDGHYAVTMRNPRGGGHITYGQVRNNGQVRIIYDAQNAKLYELEVFLREYPGARDGMGAFLMQPK